MSCSVPASYCRYFCPAKCWYHRNNSRAQAQPPTEGWGQLFTVVTTPGSVGCGPFGTPAAPPRLLVAEHSSAAFKHQTRICETQRGAFNGRIHFLSVVFFKGRGDRQASEQGSMCTRAGVCTPSFLDCTPEPLLLNSYVRRTPSPKGHILES